MQTVTIETATGGLLVVKTPALPPNQGSAAGGAPRRSKHAKVIGDRAEAIAVRYVREQVAGAINVRHVAAERETPGWDIEYTDASGEKIAVEVKGASGSAFANFELTAGELTAAKLLRERYWLFLVCNCLGVSPRIERIQDPFGLIEKGTLAIDPTMWRVRAVGGSPAPE